MKSKIVNYKTIKPTSPDKVNDKLVKYRRGDCLSIRCNDESYPGVFITEKFNKYYDLTFIEYLDKTKPTLDDFINGKFFGSYREEENKAFPTVHKNMMLCVFIDASLDVEKAGSLQLMEPLTFTSYGYDKDLPELLGYYLSHLPQRQINTMNFDKRPDIIFLSDRLIKMKAILEDQQPLT